MQFEGFVDPRSCKSMMLERWFFNVFFSCGNVNLNITLAIWRNMDWRIWKWVILFYFFWYCMSCQGKGILLHLKLNISINLAWVPYGEWLCKWDGRAINNILALLVANGPKLLFDNVINKFLDDRQWKGNVDE